MMWVRDMAAGHYEEATTISFGGHAFPMGPTYAYGHRAHL